MKFRIVKTSDFDEQPHPQAYKEKTNDWREEAWFIDVETLEQIMLLAEEEDIIISTSTWDGGDPA